MRILVVLLASLCCLPIDRADARRPHEPSTGLPRLHFNQPPPDFVFPLENRYVRVSELGGKAVVINFWASWCHPCVDEMPYFVHLQDAFGPRVALITLSNEPVGVARTFLRTRSISLPLLEDPHGVIFGAYSVTPVPVTVVVDSGGKVSYVSVGGLDWPELQGAVTRALATPSGTPGP